MDSYVNFYRDLVGGNVSRPRVQDSGQIQISLPFMSVQVFRGMPFNLPNRANRKGATSMTRRSLLAQTLILLLVLCAPALAVDFNFLTKDKIDLTVLLAPPPELNSDAQRRDLSAVLDAQRTRTAEQIKRAVADNELSIFRFADVLGPDFTPDRLPVTVEFFKRLQSDSRLIILATKDAWDRKRPFLVSEEVSFVGAKPASVGSYPSGHSAFGYLTAIVLAEMVPEKRSILFIRGAEYGFSRVIAGVHFPSDVIAGHIAATVIAASLMQTPTFSADFTAAKSELRRVLGL
jgi:acid phosphatase (class A)